MLATFKREFFSYFRTMTAYSYFAALFLISGYFFIMKQLFENSFDLINLYSSYGIILILICPLLTMRLLITNRGMHAETLMYLSSFSYVFGKFLAALCLYLCGFFGSLIYPIVLSLVWHIPIGDLLFCQFGVLLLSIVYLTIGVFASSITRREIYAYALTVCIVIAFWLADTVTSLASTFIDQKSLFLISLFSTYTKFLQGIFSFSSLLYLLSFGMIFLLISCSILEQRKERRI